MYINLLDKKGGIYMNRKLLILSIVLVMFFGFSVFSVVGTHTTTGSSIRLSNTDYTYVYVFNATTIKANTVTIVNITINISTSDSNITKINVTVPGGFTPNQVLANGSAVTKQPTLVWVNGVWSFTNSTLRSFTFNHSAGLDNASSSTTNPSTIYMWFNVTSNNTLTEDVQTFSVLTWNGTGDHVTTTFNTLIDGQAPRLTLKNVTDESGNTVSTFASTYLINGSWIFIAEVTDAGINATGVVLYFPNSSNTTKGFGFAGFGNSTRIVMTNMSVLTNKGETVMFNATIPARYINSTDAVIQEFGFYVTDAFGNAKWVNNSDASFKIVSDIESPTVSLTAPSDITIEVQKSIKYTCSGSDSSGTSCTITVTKPDGTTYTKSGCTEQTLINTDTNLAGTYTVSCKVTDGVSRSSTTSSTFTASYATSGGGGGGGGGSSSGDEEVVDEETTSEEGTGEGTATEGTSGEVGTGSTTETTGEGEVSGESTGVTKSNIWLWIVLGVVLVGAIVAFVVIKRK